MPARNAGAAGEEVAREQATAGPGRARQTKTPPVRIAVLASGGGTNLQALLDHFNATNADAARQGADSARHPVDEGSGGAARAGGDGGVAAAGGAEGSDGAGEVARVALVLSDRADAGALERAGRAGVSTQVVKAAARDGQEVASELLEALDRAAIDLVALAGYLRLVPAPVIRRYRDRILNIHPALLPAFGGKGLYGARVHRAVLESGCRITGATVHYVDERYDSGPILIQWPVPVRADDTPESLAARVLRVEHRLYPAAVEAVARALAAGVVKRPAPFAVAEPVAFGLETAEAPQELDVRRALGLQ